jgi:ubiquinone/menaquinone biosynthesis C-methylase UbiE
MIAAKERVLFDLAERLPWNNPFDTMERIREYDLDIRTSMIIPRQHLGHMVRPFLREGARVLEVGGATGLLSLRLAACHPTVEFTVVEADDNLLAVLQDNVIFANLLETAGNVSYESARPERLPVEDGAFDVVLAFTCFSRWPDPVRGLRECRRVCQPGGLVLIYDMARDSEHGLVSFVLQYAGDYGHEFMTSLRSAYTADEMRDLLAQAGLADWQVAREGISLITSSLPLDVAYHIGMPGSGT